MKHKPKSAQAAEPQRKTAGDTPGPCPKSSPKTKEGCPQKQYEESDKAPRPHHKLLIPPL
jgi:hypothetical protein